MALQNCFIVPINAFLNDIYYIPNYQREYSWSEIELTDFWDDLTSLKMSADRKAHFFGQVVVHNDEEHGKKYIIDGQQRTITSTIFLRAIQYLCAQIYKETGSNDADYIKSDISAIHIGRQNNLHLHLGDLDNEYFRDNIQLGDPPSSKRVRKKSHERLRKAYLFFYERLTEKLQGLDTEDQVAVLQEYYDTFKDKFQLLYMEATKLEEAFVIFETLNARGKDLETADLLKNFIFGHSGDTAAAQVQWNHMINALNQADPTKFIRHYWNAAHEFTREKELYRCISKSVSSPRASAALLKELREAASLYHDITAPSESPTLSNTALLNSLGALKDLKASAFYPVVIAMKLAPSPFSEDDMAKAVQAVETLVFRNFTVCGRVANKYEHIFSDIAIRIYNGSLADVDDIEKEIRREIVSDDEFTDRFKLWTGSPSTKPAVRYILRKIHKHFDKNHELNIDNTEVHIEHIMPEDNTQWGVDEEIHETYLWRLGNLALLSGSANISISNKPFADKKPEYINSKIEPNKAIAANNQWTPKEIEERQKGFATIALRIWSK